MGYAGFTLLDTAGNVLIKLPPTLGISSAVGKSDPYTWDRPPGSPAWFTLGDGISGNRPQMTLTGQWTYVNGDSASADAAAIEKAVAAANEIRLNDVHVAYLNTSLPGVSQAQYGQMRRQVTYTITLNLTDYLSSDNLPKAALVGSVGNYGNVILPTPVTPGTGGGAKNLADLADVNVAGVRDGLYLGYNSPSKKWVPMTAPSPIKPALSTLTDVNVGVMNPDGAVLTFDLNSGKWKAALPVMPTPSSGSGGGITGPSETVKKTIPTWDDETGNALSAGRIRMGFGEGIQLLGMENSSTSVSPFELGLGSSDLQTERTNENYTAFGTCSTILGGGNNTAYADYSAVFGYHGIANHGETAALIQGNGYINGSDDGWSMVKRLGLKMHWTTNENVGTGGYFTFGKNTIPVNPAGGSAGAVTNPNAFPYTSPDACMTFTGTISILSNRGEVGGWSIQGVIQGDKLYGANWQFIGGSDYAKKWAISMNLVRFTESTDDDNPWNKKYQQLIIKFDPASGISNSPIDFEAVGTCAITMSSIEYTFPSF